MGKSSLAAGFGLALVVLGILALLKVLTAAGGLLLALALGLVVANLTGLAGRWALGAAALLLLFALPYIAFGTLRLAWMVVGVAFRALPVAVLLLGVYILLKVARR